MLVFCKKAIWELLALTELLDEPEQAIRKVESRLLDLPFAFHVCVAHILHVFNAHGFYSVYL